MAADLMLKLLLVGDKPSSKNKDPHIAFIGTKSHKRIEEWLELILEEEADIIMINQSDPNFTSHLIYATLHQYRIIALGEVAAIALANNGVVNFFKLPHPSGRNRKLNDKNYIADALRKCKHWIAES